MMRERTEVDPASSRRGTAASSGTWEPAVRARDRASGRAHGEPLGGAGIPLPVPDDLQQLLSARLASLPASAAAPLLAVAAMSHPTAELVLAASPAEARDGFAAAESRGRDRASGRARALHTPAPRLDRLRERRGAGSARDAPAPRRADRSDPEERARHLALGAEGPDAGVAGALEDAARFARWRGAPDAAAELAELARRLTPPDDDEARTQAQPRRAPSTTSMPETRAEPSRCCATAIDEGQLSDPPARRCSSGSPR